MSSIGFIDWLMALLGMGASGPANGRLDLSQTVTEVNPELGTIEHYVVTPYGYRIRVPQPADVSHSVGEMLPEVRQSLAQIPPLPRVVIELMREVQDANSSANSVGQVAASDPVLAAALLRTVNSAAMGLKRKITGVNEAVSYLGFGLVKSVLLRLRLDETMPTKGQAAVDAENLWIHSLAVSYVAEVLADRVPGVDRGFVSTLGLLHDIGKLAIISQPTLTNSLNDQSPTDHEDGRTHEARRLGTDHAGLGASLAHTWGLPSDLVQAIRFHHHPEKAFEATDPLPLRQAAYLVLVANQLAKLGFAHADDVIIDVIPDEASRVLNLNCSFENLLDDKVRQAISRAILFAAESSKQTKTAVKRLLRLTHGVDALARLTESPAASSRVTVDDAAVESLFSKESDVSCLNHATGTTREADIAKLIDAGLFHQSKLSLPTKLAACAPELLRCLLPNLVCLESVATVDLVQQSIAGEFTLGVRSDKLKFADRISPDLTPEQATALIESELAGMMNLNWVHHATISSDGSAIILHCH